MKTSFKIFLALLLVTDGAAFADAVNSQFMSAIQFAVHEPTPLLLNRSQTLLRQQFVQSLDQFPELKNVPFEARTFGNEVVFYVVTDKDVAAPMQYAVASLIQNLNGRVRTRGRSSFFLTKLTEPTNGYLETVVNDTHTGIVSIIAQSTPLRDILKQLKTQLGSLSYLIPGECAEKRIDWNFGQQEDKTTAKPVDAVMTELASALNLKFEKKNDTLIFSGNCANTPAPRMAAMPPELLTADVIPVGAPVAFPRPQQIVFPVFPLGE